MDAALRILAISVVCASVLSGGGPAFSRSWIEDALQDAAASGSYCGEQAAAIEGTLDRMRAVALPDRGRFLFINTASQTLIAYQDGNPVLQSRVVVGKEGWETPDFQTQATFVEFNPTWTVPQSIATSSGMFSKGAAWWEAQDMDVRLADGSIVAPDRVGDRKPVGFVQRPGPDNALGRVKIGLSGTGGILLHDTNDRGAFGEGARALSHGCIRVEEASAVADYVMDGAPGSADDLISSGETTRLSASMPVVIAYFTALPDEAGRIIFFPDTYGRDPAASAACTGIMTGADAVEPASSSQEGVVWREGEVR